MSIGTRVVGPLERRGARLVRAPSVTARRDPLASSLLMLPTAIEDGVSRYAWGAGIPSCVTCSVAGCDSEKLNAAMKNSKSCRPPQRHTQTKSLGRPVGRRAASRRLEIDREGNYWLGRNSGRDPRAAATRLDRDFFVSAASGANDRRSDVVSVERNRYLARTAGCNDCHKPGYAEAAGELPEQSWLTGSSIGWRGPWRTTYPIKFREYMGALSETQWLAIARSGKARPPMPWHALRDVRDESLTSIYRFVRHLGPAGSSAPAHAPPQVEATTPVINLVLHGAAAVAANGAP